MNADQFKEFKAFLLQEGNSKDVLKEKYKEFLNLTLAALRSSTVKVFAEVGIRDSDALPTEKQEREILVETTKLVIEEACKEFLEEAGGRNE